MRGANRSFRRLTFRATLGAIFFLAGVASPARAQVDFGLYAGPTIATYTGSYVDSAIRTWGIVGGLWFEWHFSTHWSVEGAISSSQKGAFEVESPLTAEKHDYRTSNIEIPIVLNYRTGFAHEKWSFRAFAGGAPAFGASCDVKPSTQFSFDEECSADTPGGELKSSDFLIQFGIGADRIFKGGSGFGFDARYSVGTSNLFSEAEANDLSVKNGVLDLKFRFILPLTGPRP
mgnify:FL=1